ncbi:B12-binding domain-containing radical SAM protein [Frankia sp. CNm7]|uniref:B12-binding domain-containing radical SAM protein n=1 Tax=Frankia nepalensis TaxID=1836974 RepID=UPI001D9E6966|nr:radical SAM protein [Frankia nepalensis]MBL7499785.1 B12-binding domain-containing radical SAM protein [Frankia nepalensis]MBL7512270.1 B12-binding domain-containing radical SAM protein [Frankia nepalensis]MBL7520445.1 B12-binding domain-containing radical SAM protein [Frankia nepalensis]
METSDDGAVLGADLSRPLDAIFINAPLRDYSRRPRVNDFTLPVLGMAYIATYAATQGFNVGVLDAEALGLGIGETHQLVNHLGPRWAGFNLLAPTYEISAQIAAGLDPDIMVMVGGHQAKAMPDTVITDPRFAALEALVLGEGETRVAELLRDRKSRADLPGVMWLDPILRKPVTGGRPGAGHHLAPDVDHLPFVDRRFLVNDPYTAPDGRTEANMVGARGCPYDCSFCGAAVSANPDITIRTRTPAGIIAEMEALHAAHDVTAFRFVDDLFLGYERFIRRCMDAFTAADLGDRFVWDATGRINILHRADDALLDLLAANGLREVALGVESGSERLLTYMGKRINPAMTRSVVDRLTKRGISVKGYFILGFPTETREELAATVHHIRELWEAADRHPGDFRASVFEFRPYPGTPEWDRLVATGRYQPTQLLAYTAVDLTAGGLDDAMRGRDEFNFSVNLQFGEATVDEVRAALVTLSREQHARSSSRR